MKYRIKLKRRLNGKRLKYFLRLESLFLPANWRDDDQPVITIDETKLGIVLTKLHTPYQYSDSFYTIRR